MPLSANEIQTLKKALLDCNKELVVEGIGIFKPSYKAASLSSDGRTIVQPRYGWSFCLGNPAYLSASVNLFKPSSTLAEKLKTASGTGESFEIAGLGLFYQQNGCYELMPEPGHLIGANQHYGLMPLSIHKVRNSSQSETRANKEAAKFPSNFTLKIAASFLGILFLSMVAIQYFSTDGAFFGRQEAGLNIFPTEQKLYQAPLIRERSTDINEILELINRVADSVMYERAKASESLALVVDSSQVMRPFFEMSSESPEVNAVAKELEQNHPIITEKKNEKPEATMPTKERKAPSQVESKKSTRSNGSLEPASRKDVFSNTDNSSSPKIDVVSRNNLAKNGLKGNIVDKKTKPKESTQPNESTYVVVGAFQSVENANRFKTDLEKRGFQISDNHSVKVGKLHRVVVFNSLSVEDAGSFLAKAQKEISPGAWVLTD